MSDRQRAGAAPEPPSPGAGEDAAPPAPGREPLGLFQAVGVEIEWMIVARESLDALPAADHVLRAAGGEAGAVEAEVEVGPLAWSNELVLHVIEAKTNGPAPSLRGLSALFLEHARRIDALLAPVGGRLLGGGMHPWMDPARETRLWPHEHNEVYRTFDRIFGCRGHGFANLQAVHLNLPFAGDEEFGRLHAAVRVLLPILPALSAASPVADGRPAGAMDARLAAYRVNCARVPSVTGEVVPEPVFDRAGYHALLAGIYRDLVPHDPGGVLRHEWVNARGAIARFDRDAIEVRVIDTQETPAADLAVLHAAWDALRALCEGRAAPLARLRAAATAPLARLLRAVERDADAAVIDDADYLSLLGVPARRATAGDVWRRLCDRHLDPAAMDPEAAAALGAILARGPLARRLSRALGPAPSRERLGEVWRALADCLTAGRTFEP